MTDFHSFTVNEDKHQNQSIWRFLLRSGYAILIKIRKWLKLLNSVPFFKKTHVNHVNFRIWSSWLTFTVVQWMKTNFKHSQFSRFLLRSQYAIQVKIWPSLHSNLINFTDFHSFTVNEENSKISQFSSFLLRSGYAIEVKNLKMTKTSS